MTRANVFLNENGYEDFDKEQMISMPKIKLQSLLEEFCSIVILKDAEGKAEFVYPMNEINDYARILAVTWVENHKPTGGFELEQKHKLASDIMNYAKIERKWELMELIEFLDAKRKEHIKLIKVADDIFDKTHHNAKKEAFNEVMVHCIDLKKKYESS